MRLLYLTNKPLFPSVDGGCKAMAQMLHCLLNLGCEIDHVCISTHKHPFDENSYPEEIKQRISIQSIPVDTTVKPGQAFRSLFSQRSFNISRFDDPKAKVALESLLSKKSYDVVLLESLYTTPYLRTIRQHSNAKVVLRSHNVEFLLWQQLASNCKSGWRKWYLRKLARDLRAYELQTLQKVDAIFSITKNDLETVQRAGITTRNHVIPVALRQTSREILDDNCSLFFIGSMNWQPNLEAADHLVNSIFPKVRKQIPEVELHIAGSYMGTHFPSDPENGITNHGFAENLQDFMSNHGILVLPIKSGSGVRIKLLEAMALGVPIVSSATGALGISEDDGILISSTDEQMVEQIIELFTSPEKRQSIGHKAWEFVHKNLSVERVSQMIADEFKN
jgi:glycosyltransferase involved in cell wall biosynthesis